MKVVEIKPKEAIIFEVVVGGKPYEFQSSVIGEAEGALITEPIRMQDKVVSFESNNISINLIYKRKDGAPMVWRRVLVETSTYKRQTVYKVVCKEDGKPENRRDSYRLTINRQSIAQLGINTKGMEVIIHDISESGFSIITNQYIENINGILVHTMFEDGDYKFSLLGTIVRKVKYKEGFYLYGCRLNRQVNTLSKYITEMQRKEIVTQNEVVIEARNPAGYGDLRKQQEENMERREKIVKGLSSGESENDRDFLKSDRYKNVKLNDADSKKVDYDRYKGLKLN